MRDLARVVELLDYEPVTGVFRWKRDRPPHHKAGDVAGSSDAYGYRKVKVDGLVYLSHRLAWFVMHGVWPEAQIDHINGVKDDNRIANLRLATNAQNRQNVRRADRDSASGLLGAHRTPHGWRASIVLSGKQIGLGSFRDAVAAHEAYLAAKAKLHPFQTLVPA